MRIVDILSRELRATIRHPRRISKLFDAEARERLQRPIRRARSREVGTWEDRESGFRTRRYTSYDEYVTHQASKLSMKNLDAYEAKFEEVLANRLSSLPIEVSGVPVLCLAARLGAEVRAFQRLGAFAVGIDLNPGRSNPYVLPGDFHSLQFPSGSAGTVFTNSTDHALDLPRMLREVVRVLDPHGFFVAEVMSAEDASQFGQWEATVWPDVNQLVVLIEAEGFNLEARSGFDYPWEGESLLFSVRRQ